MTLTDLQVVSLVWHHQLQLFDQFLGQVQVPAKSLQDSAFLGSIRRALYGVNEHFGLQLATADVEEIMDGPVLQRNVKASAQYYDRGAREQEADDIRARYAGDISDAISWSRKLPMYEHLAGRLAAPLV